MKPLNRKERRIAFAKFFGVYNLSIALLVVAALLLLKTCDIGKGDEIKCCQDFQALAAKMKEINPKLDSLGLLDEQFNNENDPVKRGVIGQKITDEEILIKTKSDSIRLARPGDELYGLVADVYGDILKMRAGMKGLRDALEKAKLELINQPQLAQPDMEAKGANQRLTDIQKKLDNGLDLLEPEIRDLLKQIEEARKKGLVCLINKKEGAALEQKIRDVKRLAENLRNVN